MQVYNIFLTKFVRHQIVRLAKGRNLTNYELWKVVKSFKVDAIQKNLVICEEGVQNIVAIEKIMYSLKENIVIFESLEVRNWWDKF